MMLKIQHVLATLCLLAASAAPAFAVPKWQQFPTPPPLPLADESGFADVNGISMYYAVYGKGNGAPLLLIHGGLSSSDVWGFEVPALAAQHEVIIADSRGQGRSTRTHEPLTYHIMAEDYVALLDYLGIDQVALVGWSDGGIIGLDIAINHPARLSKLFAQAANVTPGGLTSIPVVPPRFQIMPALTPEGYTAEDICSLQEKQRRARERIFKRLWATEPNYTEDDLRRISVPAEIVVGDHDEAIRPEHTAFIADTIPGARLVILKDVGHSALYQDPDQYLQAISDFIDN